MVFLWTPGYVLGKQQWASKGLQEGHCLRLLPLCVGLQSYSNRIGRLVGNIPGTGVVRKGKDSSSKTSGYVSIALVWFPRITINIRYLRGVVLYEWSLTLREIKFAWCFAMRTKSVFILLYQFLALPFIFRKLNTWIGDDFKDFCLPHFFSETNFLHMPFSVAFTKCWTSAMRVLLE